MEYGGPSRTSEDWRRLLALVDFLEEEDIEQFAHYEGVCPQCHSPYYGILDESKCKLPLGEGMRSALLGNRGQTRRTNRASYLTTVEWAGAYEVRQDIVRSGLWTREQLRMGRFNQHELEVNERSFYDIRPKRCDCDFGSEPEMSEYELAILASLEAMDNFDQPTAVETSFLEGKPVRTGFRRRSAAARRARRERVRVRLSTGKSQCVIIVAKPRVHPSVKDGPLSVVNRSPIELAFKFIPPVRGPPRKVKFRLPFGIRPPKGYERTDLEVCFKAPSVGAHEKYFYFYRKRGFWFPSKHHPMGE